MSLLIHPSEAKRKSGYERRKLDFLSVYAESWTTRSSFSKNQFNLSSSDRYLETVFVTKRRGEKREKNFEPNREIQSWVSAHIERHPWKRCATKGVTRSNVVHPDGINPPKYQRKPFQKKNETGKKKEKYQPTNRLYIYIRAAACEKRERIRVDYRRHCEALHG